MKKLQYPIGRFQVPSEISNDDIQEAITILDIFPEKLRLMVAQLPQQTLQQPYRPEGWTIQQLVHHISDSHHHSYARFKWALTEDTPNIKPYQEKDWAALGDYATMPIAWSLMHLEAVHHKLVYLLNCLTAEQWNRTYQHPDKDAPTSLKETVLLYAWHSMHHYAHIKNALDRQKD